MLRHYVWSLFAMLSRPDVSLFLLKWGRLSYGSFSPGLESTKFTNLIGWCRYWLQSWVSHLNQHLVGSVSYFSEESFGGPNSILSFIGWWHDHGDSSWYIGEFCPGPKRLSSKFFSYTQSFASWPTAHFPHNALAFDIIFYYNSSNIFTLTWSSQFSSSFAPWKLFTSQNKSCTWTNIQAYILHQVKAFVYIYQLPYVHVFQYKLM